MYMRCVVGTLLLVKNEPSLTAAFQMTRNGRAMLPSSGLSSWLKPLRLNCGPLGAHPHPLVARARIAERLIKGPRPDQRKAIYFFPFSFFNAMLQYESLLVSYIRKDGHHLWTTVLLSY